MSADHRAKASFFVSIGQKMNTGTKESAATIAAIPSDTNDGLRISASEWLTAEEAAQHLKVKTRTLLLWVRQGKIKGYSISGTKRRVWRFRRSDLDAAMIENPVLPFSTPSVRPEERMVQ